MNECRSVLMVTGRKAYLVKMEVMRLESLFSEKALKNVVYKGAIPYEVVGQEIENAEVCVFPSFAESFGMVTIEAMAMCKAVVTGNFGWESEIITNNVEGLLINPKDHLSFAIAVINLLNDKEKAVSFGNNARKKIVNNFSNNIIDQKNLDFYHSILSK